MELASWGGGCHPFENPDIPAGHYFLKISAFAGFAADWAATTLMVASTSLVTGGRHISLLQAC